MLKTSALKTASLYLEDTFDKLNIILLIFYEKMNLQIASIIYRYILQINPFNAIILQTTEKSGNQ